MVAEVSIYQSLIQTMKSECKDPVVGGEGVGFRSLSRKTGISTGHLLKIYRGQTVPSVEYAGKIASALGYELIIVKLKGRKRERIGSSKKGCQP